MQIKHIQANIEGFKYHKELLEFFLHENADIINLQEVSDGDFWRDCEPHWHIQDFADSLNTEYIYFPTLGRVFPNGRVSRYGEMILSKFPIKNVEKRVLQDTPYTEYPHDYGMFSETKKYDKYKHAESIPLGCLVLDLDVANQPVRTISAHFHVSKGCQETKVIYADAKYVAQLIQEWPKIPTILSGDFNIQSDSNSIRLIDALIPEVQTGNTNTLNREVHPGFKNDIPYEGYHVDHVFARWFKVVSCHVAEVNVSDHYPIVTTLSLDI